MSEPDNKWMVGPMITIFVIVCGLAMNWGITKSSLDALKIEINKAEVKLEQHENKIRDIQIQQAGNSEILKSIQNSLEEIKEDLRILRSNSNRTE